MKKKRGRPRLYEKVSDALPVSIATPSSTPTVESSRPTMKPVSSSEPVVVQRADLLEVASLGRISRTMVSTKFFLRYS